MLNASDKRNVVKTCQASSLLVQDLQGLVQSSNPLLADVALEILQQALQIELRLKRIESIAHNGEDSA